MSAVTSWISRRMNHGPWETGYKLCIELARRGGGSEIHIQKVHIKTSLRNWIKKYGGVTNLCEKSRNKLGLSCAKPMLSNFFKIHSSFPIFSRFSSTFQDCFITRHFPKCYLLYLEYFHQFFIIFSSTFFSQFFNIYSYFKDFTFHLD